MVDILINLLETLGGILDMALARETLRMLATWLGAMIALGIVLDYFLSLR